MKRLLRLCLAARALHQSAEITLLSVPDKDDLWAVRVTVGDVIFVETAAKPLEEAIVAATVKLKSLSQRTLRATLTPPSSDMDEDGEPPTMP